MSQLFFLRGCRPALLFGLLGLLLLASVSSRAQGPEPPRSPVLPPMPDSVGQTAPRYVRLPADTAPTGILRAPATARLAELRGQPEFQYVEPEPEQSSSDSVWSRFWRELWRRIFGLFSGPTYETRGRYVVYALFAAAFGYVLLRVLQLDITGLLGRRGRTQPLAYESLNEDIHSINFEAELERAELAGNYRLALRLGYLQTLRHLTDHGLIQWQPDKTNQDYLRELAATPLTTGFRTLTRQFEYVWYGELPLAAGQYPPLREQQRSFIRQLSGGKKLLALG